MISASIRCLASLTIFSFSAIARSVMISAEDGRAGDGRTARFSAIARSVMISAWLEASERSDAECFSAIARSVMISADSSSNLMWSQTKFQCYSS